MSHPIDLPVAATPHLHSLPGSRVARARAVLTRSDVESETRKAAYAYQLLEQLRAELRDDDLDDVDRAGTYGRFRYWADKLTDGGALDFLAREIDWDRADTRKP